MRTFSHAEFLNPAQPPSLMDPGLHFWFWKRASSGLLISGNRLCLRSALLYLPGCAQRQKNLSLLLEEGLLLTREDSFKAKYSFYPHHFSVTSQWLLSHSNQKTFGELSDSDSHRNYFNLLFRMTILEWLEQRVHHFDKTSKWYFLVHSENINCFSFLLYTSTSESWTLRALLFLS